MSKYAKFYKYVEAKEKALAGDGDKTELVADYPGEIATKPPQGKNSQPYKKGQDSKQMTMKGEKDQSPLADAGDKKNVYKPKDLGIDPVDGKKVSSWGPGAADAPKPKAAKLPSKNEQFIEKTRKMNLREFNRFMHQRLNVEDMLPPVTAPEAGKIYPDPLETVRYVVALANANNSVMENLTFEFKRQNALKKILGNMLDHPETYREMSRLLQDPVRGERRRNNFMDVYMEIVGDPIGFELPKAKSKALDNGPDLGAEDEMPDDDQDFEEPGPEEDLSGDEEMPDDEMDMDDEEMEEPPVNPAHLDSLDSEMDDGEEEEEDGGFGATDDNFGDEDFGDEDVEDDDEEEEDVDQSFGSFLQKMRDRQA